MSFTSFCTNRWVGLVRNVGKFPVYFKGTKCMVASDRHLARVQSRWHGWRYEGRLYEHRQRGRIFPVWSGDVGAARRRSRPVSPDWNRWVERPRNVDTSDGRSAPRRRRRFPDSPGGVAALDALADGRAGDGAGLGPRTRSRARRAGGTSVHPTGFLRAECFARRP